MSKVLIYSQEDLDLILELEKQKNEELHPRQQKTNKNITKNPKNFFIILPPFIINIIH